MEDVEKAELFYKSHNVGFTPFPFPKDLFVKIVKEHDGYFPGNWSQIGSLIGSKTDILSV